MYKIHLLWNTEHSFFLSFFFLHFSECEDYVFDDLDLQMLFVLMLMIAHGAFVRTILRYFKLSIPYTVVLMLSGLILGYLSSKFCQPLHTYTAIARIPPKIILFVFLPVLIFESAFSITPHIFVRSLCQVSFSQIKVHFKIMTDDSNNQ